MALTVRLNGQDRTFADLEPRAPLASLVAALGLTPDRVAIELRGEIVRRAAWPETGVDADDRIEIVHFVGGGAWR